MNLLFAAIPLPYRLLAFGVAAMVLVGFGWVKGAAHGESRLQAFVQAQAVEAAKAQERANARMAQDKQRKESTDAQAKSDLARLTADIDRLRQRARTSAYIVPAATAVAGSIERACFDRAKLDDAIRQFADGTAALVGEGEVVRLRLDNAIRWAQ